VTLIEAALCGVPAVATDVGSTREVVVDGRTGRTVPPEARWLAEATGSVLSDEHQRHRMGAAARLFAEEHFGIPKMTQRHADLYESLMADPPARIRRHL
jgi:glycosyltransferase involved in cell wall biosynthesis